MKISSYNINDVAYHYIGIRVLDGMTNGNTSRNEQLAAISRNAYKYITDKALRLMLPEPRGTYEAIGEKICQELVHMHFARAMRGEPYELTDSGKYIVKLLNERRYSELRRNMVSAHLSTYDNLRLVFFKHLELGALWRPILEAGVPITEESLRTILTFVLGEQKQDILRQGGDSVIGKAGKQAEDGILAGLLSYYFGRDAMGIPLFRALCDRLISLRLLNMTRVSFERREFMKSYSTAALDKPEDPWYAAISGTTREGETFRIYISEPDMNSEEMQQKLLSSIADAFKQLKAEAGYYDLPDVRDFVCERLRIPEAAFDEGLNRVLGRKPSPLTVGLRYERISARRKPLVRATESMQLYNLLRAA
jgi:hypothetical protein